MEQISKAKFFNFFLLTLDPPRNTLVSISLSVPLLEGSSVNLTCSSQANPAVENYTWFKKDGTDTSQTGSGEVLRLTSLTSSDSRQYFCEARNKEGAHNSTVLSLILQGQYGIKCYVLLSIEMSCCPEPIHFKWEFP